MATVNPAVVMLLLLVTSSAFPSIIASSELSLVVSGPTLLQLSPSLILEESPGVKPGTIVKCERVLIHGLPRIKHLDKFASSVKVNVSRVSQSGSPPTIEVCFHRNSSLGVGMCPQERWEKLTKGLWTKSMSPFDHKILDIRLMATYSESLEVSLDEEFFAYRIVFLILGVVLMSLASSLGNSLAFYYSSAMAVGVFLVILMVLFHGMKLLPSGRNGALGFILYSCSIGLGSYYLRKVPGLLRSLLVEIGLSEDMYNPLATFLLVFLVIGGAWLGFWVVRKLVLTEDGSIDVGVSHFVTWSIRIVASVMILQSSVDPLLAAEALIGGIALPSVLGKFGLSRVVLRIYKTLCKLNEINFGETFDLYSSPLSNSSVSRRIIRTPRTPIQGPTSQPPTRLSESETFYSTFHETPERKKFTKKEWESFTKDSTRKALEGLVSSPDFSKWAVSHADRITLAPKNEIADKQKRRWFYWF